MSKGLNKVQLIGNLGKDPEARYTPAGVMVAQFNLAVSNSRKVDGQKVENTEWFTIVAWRELAEICNSYLKKGQRVYVEGRIKNEKYDKDGVTHYSYKIVADEVIMLSSGNGGGENADGSHPEDLTGPEEVTF